MGWVAVIQTLQKTRQKQKQSSVLLGYAVLMVSASVQGFTLHHLFVVNPVMLMPIGMLPVTKMAQLLRISVES